MGHTSNINRYLYVLCLFVVVMIIGSCKGGAEGKSGSTSIKKDADVNSLYSGFYQNPNNLDERQQNEIIEYAVDNNLPMQRLESGVYYMITQDGKGPSLRWGEKIIVDYRGYFLDGREFDSSYSKGKPWTISVGQAIPGWNEVLARMKTESKCTVIIPSRLAYRDKEYAGIPPNSILVFDIHVLF